MFQYLAIVAISCNKFTSCHVHTTNLHPQGSTSKQISKTSNLIPHMHKHLLGFKLPTKWSFKVTRWHLKFSLTTCHISRMGRQCPWLSLIHNLGIDILVREQESWNVALEHFAFTLFKCHSHSVGDIVSIFPICKSLTCHHANLVPKWNTHHSTSRLKQVGFIQLFKLHKLYNFNKIHNINVLSLNYCDKPME